MNVCELLKKSPQLINNPIEVSGWVVFIKKQLYILDVSIEEFDDSDHLSRIKFKNRDIAYVLLDAIIFALGGGETAIYHMAFVNGTLLECDGELLLDVDSIVLEDKYLNQDDTLSVIRIPVDISAAAIAEAKLRDRHLFSDNPSGDWMDYMKKARFKRGWLWPSSHLELQMRLGKRWLLSGAYFSYFNWFQQRQDLTIDFEQAKMLAEATARE